MREREGENEREGGREKGRADHEVGEDDGDEQRRDGLPRKAPANESLLFPRNDILNTGRGGGGGGVSC